MWCSLFHFSHFPLARLLLADIPLSIKLAAADPLAYYNILETVCRTVMRGTATSSSSSSSSIQSDKAILTQVEDLLQLPGYIYAKSGKRFVLRTWPHYKAYLSAHASWNKAVMKLMLMLVGRGLEDDLTEVGERGLSELMTSVMKSTLEAELSQYLAGVIVGKPPAGTAGMVGSQEQEEQVKQQRGHQVGAPGGVLCVMSSTIHMLLLLGAARTIVSVGRFFCLRLAETIPSSSPSSSRNSSGSGSSRDSSSSGKGSGTTGVSSSSSKKGIGTTGVNGSSTTGGVGSVRIHNGDTSLIGTGLSIEAQSAAKNVILSQLTAAALQLQECLAKWQQNAAAVGMLVTANPSSSSSAAGVGFATAAVSLPERFSRVPSQGLPKAVAQQLELCSGKWWQYSDNQGRPLFAGLPQRAMELLLCNVPVECQLDVLHNLVLLCEVLLAEVPCPLGCSNPGCVNLGGESEVREAHKACAACKVVYYCSRRCQVDHWKAGHGKICGRLGQQRSVESG